ncbi:MAG: hypothetical protein K1X44_04835 [Alphaproteobacteria bacterium]|nr:hypothetical protein [Alphaproteobacteria bacterium]
MKIKYYAIILCCLTLSACHTPPERQNFSEISFKHLPPFTFNVAEIEIADGYKPLQNYPYVDHLFRNIPKQSMIQWAKDRLKAGGNMGFLRYTILEASIKQVPLKMQGGIKGLLTTEQSDRYDIILKIQIDVENNNGLQKGQITAEATRSQTVPENATLNQREKIWYQLTEQALQELNTQTENNIRQYLQKFLMQ